MYFCNVVSKTRLYQFIALYDSIKQNCGDFKVFVLCMDDDTARILLQAKLENIHVLTLQDIENKQLLQLKAERNISEYCWTLKPVLMTYVFEHFESIDWLTYLDADMLFFNNPKDIFNKSENCSVLLSEHASNENIKFVEEAVGRFNAGFVSFRNDFIGRESLHWWKKQCIKWCFNTTVTGEFGDQKYLEELFNLFRGSCPVAEPGVNVAPWNDVRFVVNDRNGVLYVNDSPLILYHFCGFRLINKNTCIFKFGNTHKPLIHNPYMRAVKSAVELLDSIDPGFDGTMPEELDQKKSKTIALDTV